MATIVRDRVRDAMKAGRTLAQIKAAKVTLEYDGLYSTRTIRARCSSTRSTAISRGPRPLPLRRGRVAIAFRCGRSWSVSWHVDSYISNFSRCIGKAIVHGRA